MDPSLLKQREAFKRHALSTPVIEKFNKRPSDADSASSKSKISKKPKHDPPRPAKGRLLLPSVVFQFSLLLLDNQQFILSACYLMNSVLISSSSRKVISNNFFVVLDYVE